MHARSLAPLAALLFAAAPLPAQIVNGSFETPLVPAGSFTLFVPGNTFSGWTVVGATGHVAIVSNTFVSGGVTFPAQSGAQWLDLTGLSNTATGVEQTFATTPGTAYDLSFWVGNVINPGGIYGTTSTVNLLLDGAPLASAVNSAGGLTQTWQQFTRTFTAAGPTTTVRFLNGDASTDNTNGLDNVTLSVAGQSVVIPEPASLVLAATGLGALALVARLRAGRGRR